MNYFIQNGINELNSKIDQNTKSFKKEYIEERLKYFNVMLKTAKMVDVEGTSQNTPVNFFLNRSILENYFLNNALSKFYVVMLNLEKETNIDDLSPAQCTRLYKFLNELRNDFNVYKKNVDDIENILNDLHTRAKKKCTQA